MLKIQGVKQREGLAAALLFLFFAALYAFTASPGIQFEDTSEFVLSAMSLGVSHPPGYPLYNLLGHLFQFIPAGDMAFSLTLMSALLSAAAVTVLFAACRRFGLGVAASAAGAILFGVSRTFWSQSVIQEVYSLNVIINAGLLWSVAVMLSSGGTAGFRSAALLIAVSAVNHYTTPAAFIPLIAALLITSRKRSPARVAQIVACAFAFAAILALYSAIPLRAAAAPLLNWRNPDNLGQFLLHIKRAQFGQWENQLAFDMTTYMKYLSSFVENLSLEFTAAFVFLAFFGAALLLAEKKKLFNSLLWLFTAQSVLILFYVRFHANEAMFSVARVFFIGAYLVLAILAAAGIDRLSRGAGRAGAAIAAVLILALLIPLKANFADCDMRRETISSEFGLQLFKNLRRDSLFLLQGSHFTAPSIYLRYGKNMRPDVTLLDSSGNILRSEIENMRGRFNWINMDLVVDRIVSDYSESRPFAMSFPRMFEGLERTISMRGPLFYRSDVRVCDKDARGWSKLYEKAINTTGHDYETRMLPSLMKARQAECEFMNGENGAGINLLRESSEWMPGSAHVALFAGQLAERYGYQSIALEYYEKALELCPTFTDAIVSKAQLFMEQLKASAPEKRSYIQPEELFEKALKISPNNMMASLSVANINYINGDFSKAETQYLKLLKEYPESVLVRNNLANVYMKMSQDEKSRTQFLAALSIDPDSSLTLMNFSSFYIGLGQLEEAKKLLQRLLANEPESAYGHYNLGLAFQGMGDYNTAIIHYRAAVKTAPVLQQGWENLILLLLDMKRYGEAADAAREMVEKGGPTVKTASEGLWGAVVKKMIAVDRKDDALREMDLMKKTGRESLVVFSVQMYMDLDMYDEAAETTRAMIAGSESKRAVSYEDLWGEVIKKMISAGHEDEALRELGYMRKVGREQMVFFVVQTLMDMKKYDEAAEVARDLVSRGVPLDAATSENLWSEVVTKMKADGLKADVIRELKLMEKTNSEALKKFAEKMKKDINKDNI